MPEPIFGVLAQHGSTLLWPSAETVRRRGRQRTRRRRAAVSAAVQLCSVQDC